MKNISFRTIIQLVFFILVFVIAINHQLAESGNSIEWLSNASLHAICPFGGVASVYSLVVDGNFVKLIYESSMVLLIIVIGLAIMFGPVFCGWICPLGSIQDWFSNLGKKLKLLNKWTIPRNIDSVLRYFRYVVLIMVLIATAKHKFLVFANIDPYNALFTFWTRDVALASLVVLIATLVMAIFIERPWCKYFCPFGAFLGLFNLIRIFKIKRNETTCINCSKCDVLCPMNIEISNRKQIRNHQCITCLKCTSEKNCPVVDTVELKI